MFYTFRIRGSLHLIVTIAVVADASCAAAVGLVLRIGASSAFSRVQWDGMVGRLLVNSDSE